MKTIYVFMMLMMISINSISSQSIRTIVMDYLQAFNLVRTNPSYYLNIFKSAVNIDNNEVSTDETSEDITLTPSDLLSDINNGSSTIYNNTNCSTVVPGLPSRSSIVDQINSARINPKYWANLILTNYTSYGTPAEITEAVNYMNNATALNATVEVLGLDITAQNQANYLIQGWGSDPHSGCNNSQPWDRVGALGKWKNVGENVIAGYKTPQDMVVAWLIDSGINPKGHRINIMNPKYDTIGVGISLTKTFGLTVVTDFAGGFKFNSSAILPPMNVQLNCTTGYSTVCLPLTNISAIQFMNLI